MTSPQGDATQAEHASSLSALIALLLAELRKLWAPLTSGATTEIPRDAVKALIEHYATAAATLGADFYDGQRLAAGVRGPFRARPANLPPDVQVEAAIRWAAQSLAPRTEGERLRTDEAFAQLSGATQRLVRNTDRLSIAESASVDTKAAGWLRVATGDYTCWFCQMMCIRGPVYRSRNTAGAGPNDRFHGEGEFKFHNNDDCIVVPVFDRGSWQPSDQILAWERRYYDATSHVFGDEKRKAFRRAVEGADRSTAGEH